MALEDERDPNESTNHELLLSSSSRNDPETDRLKPSAPFSAGIGGHDEQPISLMSDLWLVVSVITFIADVCSDVLVSVQYYSQRNYWYFGLTLGLVSTASLILQIFSIKWFHDDGKKTTFKLFGVHLFQIGPLYRYWSAIKLCWLSRHGGVVRAEERFVTEWRDLCMLRLLGAFAHSAPQCVLQLFILTQRDSFVIGEDLMVAIAAITSFISIIWALVCYSKALRDLRDNARDLPWLGFSCQVLWRGCMITSRVVALVLFASHFKQWMLLAVTGHWILMSLWLSCQRTQFCIDENGQEHPCKEKIFNSIIAFIYIFCFFNTKEGITRKRIVLYYSVMLVENSLLISMWYPNRTLSPPLTYAALATVWGGFVLGVIFMVLYYRFYHHSHTFKGMFLRKRRFTLHGRKMYGLYFCCCFRIKRWELGLYDVTSDPQLLMSRGVDEENGEAADDMELEVFPRDNSQLGNLYWDHDDIRPLNGACIKGRRNSPEREMLLRNAQSSKEDTEEVPDIVITAASPLALSPRDSQSSLADNPENSANSEMTCTCNDDGRPNSLPDSPIESPVEKAKRMLASKLYKDDATKDEVISDGEDDIPRINYGSVSFGNRYSLVSSDCISLSSESSLSSFTNSLNDLLDRMGVNAKANQEPEHKGPKTSTADEGIFSDERDSPTKSSSDKEVEPVPVNHQKDVKNRVKLSDSSANSETVISRGSSQAEEEEEEVMKNIMDAPPSPHPPKKISPPPVKDEGNESESSNVSSDGLSNARDRRHSYDEMLIDSLKNVEEEINKRHSFDIAELSRKSKRANKKGKNRKRYNKIITFDNFVSSPLKPGKFGSLRKSFERLSKIQEDHEEFGLLSDEALPAIKEPPLDDTLPSNDGAPILDGFESKENINSEQNSDERELERPSNVYIDRGTTDEPSQPLWVKKDANKERLFRKNMKQNNDFGLNDYKIDGLSLEEMPEESKLETTFFDEEFSQPSSHEETSEDSSDEVVLIEDLSPSRFSTVRRSRESVPLAYLDEVDDLDDLGTDSDSLRDLDERPRSVSPEADLPVVSTQPDTYATVSNDSESLQARSLNGFDSSGSSLFENLLYLEAEKGSLDKPGRYSKRHTYDFGSDRIARQEKVKRLGTSSSQNAMRTPGSPVWVHKAIFKHRGRKPRTLAQDYVNKSDSAIGFIQEIRV